MWPSYQGCRNPDLGLTTKARAYEGVGQEWARESHFMLLGMQESVREWTLTLPNELPLWELESQWTPEFSKGDYKGQNSLDCEVLYITGNLLKFRCSKMSSHDPFRHLEHKLWPKEGPEINWQFDSWPLKARNHPNFLACRWRATCRWKALDKDYNFALKLTSIEGLHTKLCASKIAGIPISRISGLPLGNLRTKCHLGASPMAMHIVYYKGEGGGFPQVQAVVSLVSSCLPMARPCTKSAQTTH